MRIASVGQAVFATTMIGLGIVDLLYPDFVPVWNPVPASLPAHQLLIYLSAAISLITGIGLLLKRTAAMAASILIVSVVGFALGNDTYVSLAGHRPAIFGQELLDPPSGLFTGFEEDANI